MYIYDYTINKGVNAIIIYVRIPHAVPSRISTISLTKRVNTGPALEVNWAIPQSDLAIFQYNVQYRRRETTVWDNVTIRGSPPLVSVVSWVPRQARERRERQLITVTVTQ